MTDSATEPSAIEFVSRCEGDPTVLFLPGSYSTASAWRGLWAHLPEDWRLAAISLPGYGETAETRRQGDADMLHELAAVQAAVARLGSAPVHLVGHSFGGTVALAVALSGKVEVASLALFEANPFDLIAGNMLLYSEARDLAAAFKAALEADDADAAARIIDWWGGPGCFAAMPAKVQDFCRLTARTNSLDWETDFGFRPDRGAISALDMPVLLVRGAQAIPAMVAMTDALGGLMPAARRAVVARAGHFLISTHPETCAALLTEHLTRTEAAPESAAGRPR